MLVAARVPRVVGGQQIALARKLGLSDVTFDANTTRALDRWL